MDREREQFSPERYIVKKLFILIRISFSPQKRRKKREKGIGYSRGDGTSELSKFISGMNYAGTFILRWVHLNMSELVGEFILKNES
jgi:hypothetical protein